MSDSIYDLHNTINALLEKNHLVTGQVPIGYASERKVFALSKPLISFQQQEKKKSHVSFRLDDAALEACSWYALCDVSRWQAKEWSPFRNHYGCVLIEGRCTVRGTDKVNQSQVNQLRQKTPCSVNTCACQMSLQMIEDQEGEMIIKLNCFSHSQFECLIQYSKILQLAEVQSLLKLCQ